MQEILKIVESLHTGDGRTNGKSPVQDLGFISCANAVHIKHVPFFHPCIIVVLSGRKVVYDGDRRTICDAGGVLTVPAPSSLDLRNEPDPRSTRYRALIIPFGPELLDGMRRAHDLAHDRHRQPVGVLGFARDETLRSSIKHYLEAMGNNRLRTHRLMEVLLLLAEKNPELLSYTLSRESWSGRVRVVLATDLAQSWDIAEICRRLATTESTLRRHLKRENTGFRELVQELRLTTALMQLLQTSLPVYRIAYDCGYQSVSRFSSNFHKRFGFPPRQLRESVNESEQKLAVSGQSFPL